MGIPSFYYRNMLLQYDRQLVAARRLARIRPGVEPGTPEPAPERQLGEGAAELDGETPAEARRRALVEHVARELLENLL